MYMTAAAEVNQTLGFRLSLATLGAAEIASDS